MTLRLTIFPIYVNFLIMVSPGWSVSIWFAMHQLGSVLSPFKRISTVLFRRSLTSSSELAAWIRGFNMHYNGQEQSLDYCSCSMAFA